MKIPHYSQTILNVLKNNGSYSLERLNKQEYLNLKKSSHPSVNHKYTNIPGHTTFASTEVLFDLNSIFWFGYKTNTNRSSSCIASCSLFGCQIILVHPPCIFIIGLWSWDYYSVSKDGVRDSRRFRAEFELSPFHFKLCVLWFQNCGSKTPEAVMPIYWDICILAKFVIKCIFSEGNSILPMIYITLFETIYQYSSLMRTETMSFY